MHETVDSLYGRPMFYTKEDIAASKLAVTHAGRYTVFYIATSESEQHLFISGRGGLGCFPALTSLYYLLVFIGLLSC